MKKIGCMLLGLTLLLGGCGEPDNATDLPNVDFVEVENNVEKNVEQEEIENIDSILVDEEILPNEFIAEKTYATGDSISFSYGPKEVNGIWSVTLEDYKVVDDLLGSERQGLMLFFSHKITELKQNEVILGGDNNFFKPNKPNVIYKNIKLGEQDEVTALIEFEEDLEKYKNGNRLVYEQFETESLNNCSLQGFELGKKVSCYNYYSYVGAGDYTINFKDKDGNNINYLISIE